jgi:hypothetical protein
MVLLAGIHLTPPGRFSCCGAVPELCIAQHGQHAGLFTEFASHYSHDSRHGNTLIIFS